MTRTYATNVIYEQYELFSGFKSSSALFCISFALFPMVVIYVIIAGLKSLQSCIA